MQIKKNDLLYYIAFFLVEIATLCGMSSFIDLGKTLNYFILSIAMILFIFKILKSNYKTKELVIAAFISIICLYISLISRNLYFIVSCLAIIGIKNTEIKKIVKFDMIIKTIFFIPHLLLYSLDMIFGMTELLNEVFISVNNTVRYTFYFTHPNAVGGLIISILMDIIILNEKKTLTYILCTIIAIIFFTVITSRTPSYLFLIFMIIAIFSRKPKINKIINISIIVMLLTLILFNFYISKLDLSTVYSDPILSKINQSLSWRLSFSINGIQKYGVHILPNAINDEYLDESIIIDNFYIRSFIQYGIIAIIILLFLYYFCYKKEKNNIEVASLFIFPLYLFMELYPINVTRTIILLVIGNILINNKRKCDKNEDIAFNKK